MSHVHPHSHNHSPESPHDKGGFHSIISSIRNGLVARLHNTELWADYMPRVSPGFYGLALLGMALLIGAYLTLKSGFVTVLLLGASILTLLPVIWAVFFVLRRQRLRFNFRNQILDAIPWRGDEQVLDIGCGSGVLLNGAALRLKNGKATGIDIWAPHSGGGNLNLLMRNARAEKVTNRIAFKEMDARQMTFADATFDVVLSSGAMHHMISNQEDFEKVVREIIRVLKPGGQIVIWDIAHMVDASSKRMNQLGLHCEVTIVDKFLNYEMGIMFGRKN